MLDFSAVPFLDSTGAATIDGFVRKAHDQGALVYIAGARRPIRRVLLIHGVRPPRVRFRTELVDAVAAARTSAEAGHKSLLPESGKYDEQSSAQIRSGS